MFSTLKRFPFDSKNPTGYLAAAFIQFCFAIYPFQYSGCFMSIAFGAFMFITNFIEIMENELRSINKMSNDHSRYRKKMCERLSAFIWTHANLKQLSGRLHYLWHKHFQNALFAD